MPKSNTQSKRDERSRKRRRGLIPKEVWCKPIDWPSIQAYVDSKASRRKLIDTTPNDSKLEHKDEQIAGIGFSLGQGEVGEHHDKLNGKMALDIGVLFQIIATDPESLQVLINKLNAAKSDLVKKFEMGGSNE